MKNFNCKPTSLVIPNIKTLPASADTVVENYRFIPLETSGKCLIKEITKIVFADNRIFILDRPNKNALIFDGKGMFVNTLGREGRGPGEHLDIWDMSYDEENNQIVLLDLSGRKLMYYDINGKLIDEKVLYWLYTNFEFNGNFIVEYAGHAYNDIAPRIDRHKLILPDKSQHPLAVDFEYTKKERSNFNYSWERCLRKFGKDVYYYDMLLSDTIWRINGLRLLPDIVFSFKGQPKLFSENDLENMSNRLYEEKTTGKRVLTDYMVSDKYVFLESFRGKDEPMYYIHSKATGNSICYNGLTFEENRESKVRLGDLLSFSFFELYDNNTARDVVQPMLIKRVGTNLKEISKYNSPPASDRRLIEEVDIEDNPVLMMVKFKDF